MLHNKGHIQEFAKWRGKRGLGDGSLSTTEPMGQSRGEVSGYGDT